MASKIFDEISTATGFAWNPDGEHQVNLQALVRSTDTMKDPEYDKFSAGAKGFLDSAAGAIEKAEDIPEFPDYVENAPVEAAAEPAADPAPRRRRRAPTTPATESAAAPAESAPADTTEAPAKVTKKRRSRKKAAAKSPEVTPADCRSVPGTDPDIVTPRVLQRGDKMDGMRQLFLDSPHLGNKEAYELVEAAGLEPQVATVNFVNYNTKHTLKWLREMGYYDHDAELSRRAAESAAADQG